MKHVFAALMVLGVLATSLTAQETGVEVEQKDSSFGFHGFVFAGLNVTDGVGSEAELGHVWFIGTKEVVKDKFDVLLILSPEGPPKLLHSLWFTWKEPVRGIDAVRFGKHIPNFMHEYPNYRIDLAPMIGFSPVISSTAVARATGVEVESHVGKLQVVGAAFGGSRTGGDIPTDESSTDFYLRIRRSLPYGFTLGASQRFADERNATGLDLVWEGEKYFFTGEYLRSREHAEWYVLGRRTLSRHVHLLARFEQLRDDERRLTVGSTLGVGESLELKFNAIVSGKEPEQLLAQFTARW